MNGEGFAFFRWHVLKWPRLYSSNAATWAKWGLLQRCYYFEKMAADILNEGFDEMKETL